ncbi:MAG: winged helix-turn-helix domain-containing protein [Candidatus Helarchaeota archaeon]|nr:winged helix-turn-helix domain-containing protein [Candidatus Helarchaeota archaeon]
MKRIIVPNARELIPIIQEEISHNQDGRYMHRLHVVLFVLQGNNCSKASEFFGDAKRTIQYWMHRLISDGLNGLKDKKHPGRQPQLSSTQLEQLKNELNRSPREFGYDQNIWTGILLSQHLREKYSVTIDVRNCQKLFHKLNLSLQRPQRKPYEADPAKQEVFKKSTRNGWKTRISRYGAKTKSILVVTAP